MAGTGMKPYLAVLLIQAIYAGMILLSKAAFNSGMKSCIFIFYRQVAGTAILAPLALIFERNSAPPLSFLLLCKMFMLALIGITTSLNLASIALVYTTPTLTAAISNCLPVTTFIFAVLLRMETVKVRTIPGMAKIAGVVACLGGVATLAFYKGPQFSPFLRLHFLGLYHSSHEEQHRVEVTSGEIWIKGCSLAFLSVIFWGLWLVIQAQVLKSYPAKLTFTSLQCLLSAFQSFVVAIVWERDLDQWKLGFNVGLLAVAYTGILVTAVAFYIQAWVIEKKGPVFQAMSTPLSLVMTIFCSAFFLGEVTSLGSILGGILLVGSLYSVLWAKSKEKNVVNHSNCSTTDETQQQNKDLREVMTPKHQQSSNV